MQSIAPQAPDSTILTLIKDNDISGWNLLYDKYSPVMYGVIYAHTGDNILADEVFMKLFIHLKQKEILLNVGFALHICLLRYTYKGTREELRRRGIKYTEKPIPGDSKARNFLISTELKEINGKLA